MAEQLLTAEEVRVQLRYKSRHTVYRMYHAGKLPGIRVREMNAIRFKQKDVDALIKPEKKTKVH